MKGQRTSQWRDRAQGSKRRARKRKKGEPHVAGLSAAISGLSADQQWLNVISQNIANINTVAYKSSRVTFSQALLDTLRGASTPTPTLGGINPEQVGSGGAVNLGTVDVNMGQGSLHSTGINTDLALQGSGFFIVQGPTGVSYTRAGNFYLDANGNLVNAQGDFVQGWVPNSSGQITTSPTTLTNLQILPGEAMAPRATTAIDFAGNLNVADASGTVLTVPVTTYNSNGTPVSVDFLLTDQGGNQWSVSAEPSGSTSATVLGTLTFNSSGQMTADTVTTYTPPPAGGGTSPAITLTLSSLTQYASQDSVQALSQNGFSAGTLTGFTINPDGSITGAFSNGDTKVLGQVAVAAFTNPSGLLNQGQNLWGATNNSGAAQIGPSGTGGRGTIQAGSLEQSNVNLSQQLVDMIEAQQGYTANAKVISVAQVLMQTATGMVQP